MASITHRPRPRSTRKPRPETLGAELPPGAPQPRLSRRPKQRFPREPRRQWARKAGRSRRRLKRLSRQFPEPVPTVCSPLAQALTRPTYHRLVLLAWAALLTGGARPLTDLLRIPGTLAPGHPSSSHRARSHRRWSTRRRARRSSAAVSARCAPHGLVEVAGDDPVTEPPGAKVSGKGGHRDPVRSTHAFTAYRGGHKWVVLALVVRFPCRRRRWARPLRVAWYRPGEPAPARKQPARKQATPTEPANPNSATKGDRPQRAHKTPVDLRGPLRRLLIRGSPDRTFVGSADGHSAAHELAEWAGAHPQRLNFVSKFSPHANLFAPPPPSPGHGRPAVKGTELPDPAQVVRDTTPRPVPDVAGYGGGRREVEVVTGSGLWYRRGQPLVPVRWVFVRDRTGAHRDEYFFTTDPAMSPRHVIETYTGRWNIATTLEEARSCLGVEPTRGRCRNTILRFEPGLFVLDTVVVWLDAASPERFTHVRVVAGLGKSAVTFSDAITAVRRWLWVEGVVAMTGDRAAVQKRGRPRRQILLSGLAPAA
jgi:hypothetical protein